jgi:hypothetical protein
MVHCTSRLLAHRWCSPATMTCQVIGEQLRCTPFAAIAEGATARRCRPAWADLVRLDPNIGDFRRWKEHDAYKQSLERVLRDLTIEPEPPQAS